MLTIEDFSKMNAAEVLDTIAAYCLLYTYGDVSPEAYRDTLTCAAERLNSLRSQRWTVWAESRGIL